MLTVSHLWPHHTEDSVFLQSAIVANNPFAVLTAIVAPAILTNASSVLALGTSNRLGRVVDRTRVVANDISRFVARFLRARSLDKTIVGPAGPRTTFAEVSAPILCRSWTLRGFWSGFGRWFYRQLLRTET